MDKHPELKGLTKVVGLSSTQVSENRRMYQRMYARKRRAGSGEYRQKKSEISNTYYHNLSPEKKERYCHRVALWKYGLSIADYDVLAEKQNGVCAICGEPDKQRLAVDHNHETGVVRGLLCRLCNLGLGHFKDRPGVLTKAAKYLEE